MSAPLTHATVRGLERLRYGAAHTSTPKLVRACDREILDEVSIACGGGVNGDGSPVDDIPTCPKCAVLRDAALEGRETPEETKP